MGPRLLGDDPFGHSGNQPAKAGSGASRQPYSEMPDGSPFRWPRGSAGRTPRGRGQPDLHDPDHDAEGATWRDPQGMPDPGPSYSLPPVARAMIDCYGGDELHIMTRRGSVRFEWSEQFGPLPANKNGLERTLPPSHPFWRDVSLWNLQGRRMDGKTAIWHEPRKPKYDHLGGRDYLVIEDGEIGHDW
jgi:hypothetical protein